MLRVLLDMEKTDPHYEIVQVCTSLDSYHTCQIDHGSSTIIFSDQMYTTCAYDAAFSIVGKYNFFVKHHLFR